MFESLDEKLATGALSLKDINDFTLSLYQALEPLLKRPYAHAGMKGYLAYLITFQYLEQNRNRLSNELSEFHTKINKVLNETALLLENDINAWVSDKFTELNTAYIKSIKPEGEKKNLNGFIIEPYTEQQKAVLKAKLKNANLIDQSSSQDRLKIIGYLAYVGEPTYRFFLVFNEDIINALNDGKVIDRSAYTGVRSAHITLSYGGKNGADTLKIFKNLAQRFDLFDQEKLPVTVKFENPIQIFRDVVIDDLIFVDAYQGETNYWPPVTKVNVIQVNSEKLENLKKEFGITSNVPTHITFKVEQRKIANLPALGQLKSSLLKSKYAMPLRQHLDLFKTISPIDAETDPERLDSITRFQHHSIFGFLSSKSELSLTLPAWHFLGSGKAADPQANPARNVKVGNVNVDYTLLTFLAAGSFLVCVVLIAYLYKSLEPYEKPNFTRR